MNIVSALQEWYESSIRFRILSTIGLIVTVLMVLISFAILYQWRSLIIDELENNARSIAKSFSIPVIDALIQAEQQEITGADHLESHIHNFLENVPSIKYISIQDNRNLIIGHSNLTMYNQPLTSERLLHVIETRETLTSIFEDPEYGWVLEVLQPLQIGEKRWGTAILGFDASATRKKAGTSFFQLLFLTVVALSVTLGLIYFFIQRILSSLRSLVHEVDRLDFESGTPVLTHPHKDEIGILLNRFEHLKKRLQYSKNELEKAQHQIYQAEKLASVGRLASGVAHEVNNPLNGMRFCVYSIKKDPENTTQTKEYLNLINEGLEQIESVVTKLLGYSRQRPTSIEPVVIDDKLKTVLELLEYRLKEKNIQVNIRRTSDIKHIKADPHLLQEMMMNLLLNSLDALDSFGSITITIGQPDLNTVSLSFHDNGTGIKKEDMKLIFDPFYSTKDTGKGTGLGLSVTQGIVELHHGTITVKSEPGSFTEFIVHLPITPENEHSHR